MALEINISAITHLMSRRFLSSFIYFSLPGPPLCDGETNRNKKNPFKKIELFLVENNWRVIHRKKKSRTIELKRGNLCISSDAGGATWKLDQ